MNALDLITATVEPQIHVDYPAMLTAYLRQHCLPQELQHMDPKELADIKSLLLQNFRRLTLIPSLARQLAETDFSLPEAYKWIGDRLGNSPRSENLLAYRPAGSDTYARTVAEFRPQVRALKWPKYSPQNGWEIR